jgi:hypothetical protein
VPGIDDVNHHPALTAALAVVYDNGSLVEQPLMVHAL